MASTPDAANKDAEFRRKWREINSDQTLTEKEKAARLQDLQRARTTAPNGAGPSQPTPGRGAARAVTATQAILDETLKCTICQNTCDKPVTAPCQHNFCLDCFNDWVKRHNSTCPTCRAPLPKSMCSNPRINAALVSAIRLAMRGEKSSGAAVAARLANDERPDEAFTTERAVRAGKANAASGRIFVTTPLDHFGPITADWDPVRKLGVRVGDSWGDRLECRQWGAHFPHVAGIAGQSGQGAQSVALSGGYEDDQDNGEWFLYTGSGGRDLSGNKRTCKKQSHDQAFDKMNLALKISCIKGLPVRVVRSHKEKRSSFAPSEPSVRYDGIYRIEKCWRAKGKQEHLMCRYLFVRCDNEPAPWTTTTDQGDRPRAVPHVAEITPGMEVFQCNGQKWWDYDPATKQWGWTRPPPESQKPTNTGEPKQKREKQTITLQQRLLKEFGCKICGQVLRMPLTMLCAHTFCKECIESKFVGFGDARDRLAPTGRSMREVKVVKKCPVCKVDIADCLRSVAVNTGMAETIAKLQRGLGGEDGEGGSAEGTDGDDQEDGAPDAEPANPAAASAPKPSAAQIAAAESAKAVEALYTDFAEYDRSLIDSLLEDQGGDVPEVQAALRRMRNQARQVKRKADASEGPARKRSKPC